MIIFRVMKCAFVPNSKIRRARFLVTRVIILGVYIYTQLQKPISRRVFRQRHSCREIRSEREQQQQQVKTIFEFSQQLYVPPPDSTHTEWAREREILFIFMLASMHIQWPIRTINNTSSHSERAESREFIINSTKIINILENGTLSLEKARGMRYTYI